MDVVGNIHFFNNIADRQAFIIFKRDIKFISNMTACETLQNILESSTNFKILGKNIYNEE